MENYNILIANQEDIGELIEFGKSEFTRTFGHLYIQKDLDDYLTEGYAKEKYESWIADPHYRIWIVRSKELQSIVGYILAGSCNLPLENCEGGPYDASLSGEIKRMYLHPDTFGTGLSQNLINLALEWLKKSYDDRIFLGVWSENYRAQKFYKKNGFTKVGEYGFPVGDHIDLEFILRLTSSS